MIWMKKRVKDLKIKVLFNASVVLSGFRSPKGGSGELLRLVKEGKIKGEISEIILDEVLGHSGKLGLSTLVVARETIKLFKKILPAPNNANVEAVKKLVKDEGDAHILASCKEIKVKTLVTLDRKHLLVLKGKIKGLQILTPGELIELLKK